MKRKKQIDGTKNSIREALLELLDEHPYDKVSITELTKLAKVSRMSFYRHFEDKDAVVKYIFESINEEIKNEAAKVENIDTAHCIKSMLSVLKENYEIYALFENEDTYKMFTEFKSTNTSLVQCIEGIKTDDMTKEFISGGINSVLLSWLKNGMSEDVNKIHTKVMSIINNILK